MSRPPIVRRKPRIKEATGPQTVTYSFGEGLLNRSYTNVGTYAQLRAVRKNSTVALAREVLVSGIQAGSWSVEVDDDVSDDVQEYLQHVLKLREEFLRNTIAYGRVDYGWIGFEKLFKTDGNRIYIDSLKPLLHDMTHVMVTPHGHFNGYRQKSISWGAMGGGGTSAMPVYPLDIPVEKCVHVAFDVEPKEIDHQTQ